MASIWDSFIGGINDLTGNDPSDGTNALMRFGQGLQGQGRTTPSAIQEYNYYSKLPEEQKKQYLLVKRANPLLNQGDQFGSYDPVTGGVAPVAPINPKVSETPQFEADVVKAKEDAKVKSEKEAIYPTQAARIDNNLKVIESALNAPGFGSNFGIKGQIPNIPGSESADAKTYLDQIKGTAFLTAIGELKGSGAVSEKEGDAATAAVARLQSAQSEKSAREAMQELNGILTGAKARAAQGTKYENQNFQATGQSSVPAAGQRVGIVSPDGQIGTIDASELPMALKNKWKQQ